jgi:N-acetylneuraminic acid mutarotase
LQRTLSFAERVAYQHAIEDVYWRHRIWPKERPDPKPSLHALMSQTQLEKKVADYLRKSQALEDYWQRPISAEQLQAEIDRMAQHTQQPEVLRELFEALGNDPFVIAECLARPALADRLLTNWYACDQRIHGELKKRAEAELRTHCAVEQMKQLSGEYSEIELVKTDSDHGKDNGGAGWTVRLSRHEWDDTLKKLAFMLSDVPVEARASVAKGRPLAEIKTAAISPVQEDETRYYATAVIAKTAGNIKMGTVSWLKEPLASWLTRAETQVVTTTVAQRTGYSLPSITGGGCIDDTWTATAGSPEPRYGQAAIWTGSEMIIWGGFHFEEYLNTGGRYNPATDSWSATSTTNAPTPRACRGVWTGNEMIIWGGHGDSGFVDTGGRYDASTDSWTETNTVGAPSARSGHTAVWTGSQMIIWGGQGFSGYVSTGARYTPNTDSWVPMSPTNTPTERENHTAVWTGTEMIVWGGYDGVHPLNTGGKYNPATDNWLTTTTTNAPDARTSHTAVWTGNEMIIWGGGAGLSYFNTGGRYNASTNSWTAVTTAGAPTARNIHTAVWTGNEMIIWGGYSDLDTGGRYNPSTDTWTVTGTTNAPSGRYNHTGVWTGSEMIVWGGDDHTFTQLNTGGRYNPLTDAWAPTGTENAPSGRYRHSGVWTGSELIVWGGRNRNVGFLNTGARYAPSIDNWVPMTTGTAPAGRGYHATVWSGTEMIVWGGFGNAGGYFNSGGRYSPGTDSWVATSTTNAPVGRELPTGVWTGNEMIVWGGYYYDGSDHYVNTGGRYNSGTDSWTSTNTSNAPIGRESHTAIWTGSRMVIWGGYYADPFGHELNTGGRYDPNTDSWTATTTINVPAARDSHRAVWTGSEMIIWGGVDDVIGYSNTGGRYNPSMDAWVSTSTSNAPSGRVGHSSIWTGDAMIVWGGLFYDGDYHFLNSGGRYNPSSDSWTATSTINAPEPRDLQAAVWTGSEMVIWGGLRFANIGTNTGARYCAHTGPTPTPTPTPTPCTGRCSPTPRPRPTPAPRPRW